MLIIALSLRNISEGSLGIDKKFLCRLRYVYLIKLIRLRLWILFTRTSVVILCLIDQIKVLARTFNLLHSHEHGSLLLLDFESCDAVIQLLMIIHKLNHIAESFSFLFISALNSLS